MYHIQQYSMYQCVASVCFFCHFSYFVRPCSDFYGVWQMCPVVICFGTVYFKTLIRLGLHAAWGQSIRWPVPALLTPRPSQEMTGEHKPPQSLFCSRNPLPPSDMFRCGYHLPVSRSHVVTSEDLVSQTEESLASSTEGDVHSNRGGRHSYMWCVQQRLMEAATLLT